MRYRFIFFITFTFIVSLCCFGTNRITLVLDPGHGGHDAGAIGTYSKEKNINLNVALKVGELISANCPDVNIIYTRKTDIFVDLHERAAIANRAKADLFISIHTNAVPKGRTVVGTETYSLGMARSNDNLEVAKRENSVILYESNYQQRYAGFNPKSAESYIIFEFMQDQFMKQSAELAKDIQEQYVNTANRPNKGVKQAGFLVLRETSMPSVLTELGFISTPSEEQYLNSAKGTDELAHSIYRGFLTYKERCMRSKSVVLSNADKKRAAEEHQVSNKPITKEVVVPNIDNDSENLDANVSENAAPEIKDAPHPLIRENQEKNNVPEKEESTKTNTTIHNQEPSITRQQEIQRTAEKEIAQSIAFKIQVLVSSRLLREDSSQFKGLTNMSYYKDGNNYKYTYGESTNYKEIVELRKSIINKFPDCFIIALKNGERISIQEAQKELKK